MVNAALWLQGLPLSQRLLVGGNSDIKATSTKIAQGSVFVPRNTAQSCINVWCGDRPQKGRMAGSAELTVGRSKKSKASTSTWSGKLFSWRTADSREVLRISGGVAAAMFAAANAAE